ncbi:hypothetical protein [Paraburkholderia bannensis]|uniref:hypothetical protein n=1 Tax=Paraburkholderia bannensis TaxID=765414 RepID=UPI0004865DEE|nr:hypothetical protein [Paraburkholderia bannensis]
MTAVYGFARGVLESICIGFAHVQVTLVHGAMSAVIDTHVLAIQSMPTDKRQTIALTVHAHAFMSTGIALARHFPGLIY